MSVIVAGERSGEEKVELWLYNAREYKKAKREKKEKASRPRLRPLLLDMTPPTTQIITPDRNECATDF